MIIFIWQEFETPPGVKISFPGSGIPIASATKIQDLQYLFNCLNILVTEGSSDLLSLLLLRLKKLLMLVMGFFEVTCRYHLETKTLSETNRADKFCTLSALKYYQFQDFFIDSDHILLGFDPCLDIWVPDGDHHTTASFKFSIHFYQNKKKQADCKVKFCGVCPVYAHFNETKSDSFTVKLAASGEEECIDEVAMEPNAKRICR